MIRKLTTAPAFACLLALSLVAGAQDKKQKPWTDWSKKDADKVLNDSGWGQTQVETDTSEMFFQPTQDSRRTGVRDPANNDQRNAEGATNSEVNVKYHVRFFSARPVRQALARNLMLANKGMDAQATERLKQFAELESTNSIIVTVTFDSSDQRFGNKFMQALAAAQTSTVKNDTYLERKDGKRLFLEEYVPPGKDGFGARFIFLRTVDGAPFLAPDSGEVRFHAELGTNKEYKVDRRFKIADMMYDGKLEY